MNVRQYGIDGWRIARLLVGLLIGAGLGTIAAGGSVLLPGVGSVSALVAGGVGLAIGSALYTQLPDCGCGSDDAACPGDGDCGC